MKIQTLFLASTLVLFGSAPALSANAPSGATDQPKVACNQDKCWVIHPAKAEPKPVEKKTQPKPKE